MLFPFLSLIFKFLFLKNLFDKVISDAATIYVDNKVTKIPVEANNPNSENPKNLLKDNEKNETAVVNAPVNDASPV